MSEVIKQVLRVRHPGGEAVWNDGPVRVGRAPDNELVIQDESLSRHHAEIHPTRSGWVIRDLESANGIWVEGARVPNRRLRAGDVVLLGSAAITVTEAEVAKSGQPQALRLALIALIALGGFFIWQSEQKEPASAWKSPDARVFEARMPPPPEKLTAEKAMEAASRYLEKDASSGASLAQARRALIWAEQLNDGEMPAGGDELQAKLSVALEERFQTGRLAYIRAMKTGDRKSAGAAIRMLRETFPYDDPRSADVEKLERRFQ